MKIIIIICFMSILTNCSGQMDRIKFIKREVVSEDTIFSIDKVFFQDSSSIFAAKSMRLLKELKTIPEKFTIIDKEKKYIDYIIQFDNNKEVQIKSNIPLQNIDNLLLFEGGIESNETYKLSWWLTEDEIEIIIIPSSEQ
jgi:hypothetical protein